MHGDLVPAAIPIVMRGGSFSVKFRSPNHKSRDRRSAASVTVVALGYLIWVLQPAQFKRVVRRYHIRRSSSCLQVLEAFLQAHDALASRQVGARHSYGTYPRSILGMFVFLVLLQLSLSACAEKRLKAHGALVAHCGRVSFQLAT